MRARGILFVLAMFAAGALACTSESAGIAPAPEGSAHPAKKKKPDDPESCSGCHMREFEEVKHPLHVGKKPTTCGICHAQTGWHPDRLEHPWALTGKHATADCFFCHEGTPPKFHGTTKKCFGCHEPEFDKPPFEEHLSFEKTCDDCHTTDGWKPTKPGHTKKDPNPIAAPSGSASAKPHASTAPSESAAPPEHPSATAPTHHPTAKPPPTATPTATPTTTPTTTPTVAPQRPDIHGGASRR